MSKHWHSAILYTILLYYNIAISPNYYFINIIFLLYAILLYCLIILLFTILLHHFINTSLFYYITLLLYYSIIITLLRYYYIIILLFYYVTIWHLLCTIWLFTILLYYYTTILLYYYVTLLLYHYVTLLNYHYITILHLLYTIYSVVAPKCHGIKLAAPAEWPIPTKFTSNPSSPENVVWCVIVWPIAQSATFSMGGELIKAICWRKQVVKK